MKRKLWGGLRLDCRGEFLCRRRLDFDMYFVSNEVVWSGSIDSFQGRYSPVSMCLGVNGALRRSVGFRGCFLRV